MNIKLLVKSLLSISILPVLLSGCASILSGTTQKITVQTAPAIGATCTLSNKKGQWYIPSTPGSVTVTKSFGKLTVYCQKYGYEDGKISVKSKTGPAVFGNIILGGVPGICVDCIDGSAYNYPENIQVPMLELRQK